MMVFQIESSRGLFTNEPVCFIAWCESLPRVGLIWKSQRSVEKAIPKSS
jgi:hypothetical protein